MTLARCSAQAAWAAADRAPRADLARYGARVRTLASDELIDSVHREAIT